MINEIYNKIQKKSEELYLPEFQKMFFEDLIEYIKNYDNL